MPEEKHEAVEVVLGEMLGVAQLIEDGNRAPILPQDLRMWAERIKEAVERRVKEAKEGIWRNAEEIHDLHCNDCILRNSNVAALLAALKKIIMHDEIVLGTTIISSIARAALDAKPRNCDRPECETIKNAIATMRAERCSDKDFCGEQTDCAECATRWLLAKVEGERHD